MEAMLASKPRSTAIGALRALVVPLKEHWGQVDAFCAAGLDVLAKEAAGILYDERQSPQHLEQIYRMVVRARATHFRSVENPAQLDNLFKELDLAATKASSPLQQGVLWLASRLQQQAITFLHAPRADEQIKTVLLAVDERRNALVRALGDLEQLLPERVEAVLAALAQDVVGTLSAFEQYALAGHLLEILRQAARRPPRRDVPAEALPQNDALTPLLATMIEPVRRAELNEARQRYTRMSDDEKQRRFNEFRRALARVIADVAPFGPEGFETFCFAAETRIYPYPEPLQYIRTYARPIWTSGAQSNLFTAATTPQSVQHIYDQLAKARQGNPVVLELARAFAMQRFRGTGSDAKGPPLHELKLAAEFGWPTRLEQLHDSP